MLMNTSMGRRLVGSRERSVGAQGQSEGGSHTGQGWVVS